MVGSVTKQLTIQSGLTYVIFAHDAARHINLDAAERRIHEATERQRIKHKKRAPSYFEYQPPPVRVSQDVEVPNLGKYRIHSSVDLVVYDFGAISVIYSLPAQGPFSDLLGLSEELYDNEFLLTDSRARVEQLLKVIGDAATKTGLADIVEDYVIFSIDAFDEPFDPNSFCIEHAQVITQILRAERRLFRTSKLTTRSRSGYHSEPRISRSLTGMRRC